MDNNDLINVQYIKKHIDPNGVLVDVGAHTGGYTEFFLSQLNENGKIYCIELNPQNFGILSNKFSNKNNVVLINKAVSNTDEPITYFQGRDSYTYNIIGHDMNFSPNSPVGEIESIRLETLLENEEKINLIKIDVEGAEFSVLEGLGKAVEKVENLLVECHLDEDWKKIYDILSKNFQCHNVLLNSSVGEDSNRPYQCFCKKK